MIRDQRGNGLIYRNSMPAGHVESYFMKFNDPESAQALWLKFTIYKPNDAQKETVGETWAVFFDAGDPARMTGMKETFPIPECQLDHTPLKLRFGGNTFTPGETSGSLKNDQGDSITWDLVWTEGKEPLQLFPYKSMYTFKLPKSKVLTPYTDSRYSGTVSINGKPWKVENLKGMQGHNWGTEHAHYYAWVQGTVFDGGEDAYFEGFSGKVKLGPFVTPFLSMAFLHLDGKLLRFDSPRSWISKNVSLTTNQWNFELAGDTHILRGQVGADTDRFAGLHYYDPTGQLSYCLNSKVADARIELVDKASGKVERTLTSSGGFALEVLTKNKNHGVRMFA